MPHTEQRNRNQQQITICFKNVYDRRRSLVVVEVVELERF